MSTAGKFSQKLTVKPPAERRGIRQRFAEMSGVSWTEKQEQYCEYRLDGESGGGWLRVKQFTNGTLYLEAASEALMNQLMQAVSGQAASVVAVQQLSLSSSKPSQPKNHSASSKPDGRLEIEGAYVGTDESGKGDYFGPLVIAGVMVTEETIPRLAALGVMDSKKLNDKAISNLSAQIVEVVGSSAVSVVEIGPKKYNELYARFRQGGRNLNHLLAWGHARVIENLLAEFPECTQAVADQFGSEHYIKSQLQEKGKGIRLFQTPRAEANIGVAAASIMARNRFVQKLSKLSDQFQISLPPGAGPKVKAQAKRLIEAHGRDALAEVAKLHFKTTQEL